MVLEGNESSRNGDKIDYFTMIFHHGGVMVGETDKQYTGGVVYTINDCPAQTMTLSMVKEIATKHGCVEIATFYYGVPQNDRSTDKIRDLQNEDDIIDMAAIGFVYGEVRVYAHSEFHIRQLGREGME